MIEFGSDLINKNMIFNHPVIIENPNNYTIYNGTIIFTENATNSNMTGINIHNTDDRQTSLEIYSTVTIKNNIIYHENNNTPAKIIIIGNTLTNVSPYIEDNNIQGKGNNITAIEIINAQFITLYDFNIKLESDNPTTAVKFINSTRVSISSSVIIVKAKNNGIPVIDIINGIRNKVTENYIESIDSQGNNAVKKTGKVTK